MKKKVMKFLASMAMCTLLFSNSVSAEEMTQYSALECKDEIIQNGICSENEDGTYTFTLTKEVEGKARSSATEHVQMSYTIIPTTEEAEENLKVAVANARTGGSTTLTDSDTAGCVSAYNTIAWSTYTSGNKTYMYLTSVTGGYTASGSGSYISSGVKVKSQELAVGQSGFSTSGYKTQNEYVDLGTSVRSYSYDIPSGWVDIAEVDDSSTVMGATYTITLQRGTTTWECQICNNHP